MVYALHLVDVAKQWQVTPEALLEGFDLSYEMLQDPQRRLSLDVFNRLLQRAMEMTQELGLAIFFAQKMQISMLGFLGFAALTAKNARQALMVSERFAGMVSSSLSLRLSDNEGQLQYLEVIVKTDIQPLRDMMLLAIMLGIKYMGQTMIGRTLVGRADVDFQQHAYMNTVLEMLPDSIVFNQPHNRLYFSAEYLELPIAMANPVASQLALEQCEIALANFGMEQPFVAQVKALMYGEKQGFEPLNYVAERMHMSERTLKRQLAKYDVTYSDLIEEARQNKSFELLADPKNALADIAEQLGYSDLANFTRAFKRWTDKTPSQYRKELG